MRKFLLTALSVLIAYAIFFTYVHSKMKEERDVLLLNEHKIIETSYKAVTQMFSISIENYFRYAIMQPPVLKILNDVVETQNSYEKALLRGFLYRLLYPFYNDELKRLGIRQFHFHTPQGESFLRFHAPSENGDNLMEVRPSIKKANIEKKFVTGFEGGRIYPGFRYVFPIIHEGKHLGSVEVSLAYENIEFELSKLLSWKDHVLLLKKSVTTDMVFEGHKHHFMPSPLSDDFVIENQKISNITAHSIESELTKKINTMLKEHYNIDAKLKEGKNFSIPILQDDNGYIANFYAIDDLSGRLAAYAVTYSRLDDLVTIQHKYITSLLFGFLTFVLLGIVLYLLIEQSHKTLKEKILFETIVDKTINGVILLNAKGQITFINNASTTLLGYSLEEVIGKDSHELIHVHPHDTAKEDCPILNTMHHQKTYLGEEVFRKKSGEHFTVHLNATPFVHDNTNIGSVIIFRDISTEKEAQKTIEHLAYYDSLTELPNRKLLLDRLSQTLANTKRDPEFCGLLFIDLDNFKFLNDTKGHECGDMLLKMVAQRLSNTLRLCDTVSRFGGDEFVVLVTKLGDDPYDAKARLREIGYKILHAISEHFRLINFDYTCTASIGGTLFHETNKTINEILKDADTAMYEVKKHHKNEIKIV
ncbi:MULTISPECIES: diguanylate cyclase [unclassified Sulfurospirillum]|uniref:diguanylate cyclase domain-containing protein n=1 Tax=unclassified Sulfurospirillum TaxID=2618290 RepID=UPI00069210EF|nr:MULTISPECIES: diguanylate cyclase [unclassified Sulfurospirillum]